jgi:Tol biopolymer transport system component
MKKYFQRLVAFLIVMNVLAACNSLNTDEMQSDSSNEVQTAVAMTLQALAPATPGASTGLSGSSTNLLPHPLYFLGNDSQAIVQIYRMERDGKTKTQLTSEPTNVWDYDVSLADGRIVYEVNGQLVMVDADGSNRRVLVEGPSNLDASGLYHPAFSPDGGTLAFAHGGLNLYNFSSGVSSLVLTDRLQDNGSGQMLPVETYFPERFSPDGSKLLVALGHWEVAPSHAIYYPATNTLIRQSGGNDTIYCCSFYGGPSWTPDSASFYGVASLHDSSYKFGQLWRVDAANGAVTRMLTSGNELPKEPYLAPNGQLYFFYGTYSTDSGFFDAPVLQLVRTSPDGVTGRTVLREENFVLMNEALWAPDASFVIVATSIGRDWNQNGGVLELYYTDSKVKFGWHRLGKK